MRSEAQIGSKILSLQKEYSNKPESNGNKGDRDKSIHFWIEALEWALGKSKCSVCNTKLI
jgi:hypothetical protein